MDKLSTQNFWVDRPTFITGGSGLVGSCLVDYLYHAGADVVCLIRDWIPQSEIVRKGLLEKIKVVRGDIRDLSTIKRVINEYEIDTVFHLAAQTTVQIANRNPTNTFEVNIAGTWNLLEACRLSPTVKQVVVASSDKAYGEQADLPYTEETPLQGQHPYDVSKSCGDLISQAYTKTYGLPVVITRCGNFYGGGDLNWNRIIPGTIRSIIRGKNPIIRSNGKFVRDYFYVEDGAQAYIRSAEKLSQNPDLAGNAFNFSNELRLSVFDIVKQILELMESDLKPEILNQAKNEIASQFLDATKARELLEWKPKFTLEEGLTRTITWYQEFFKGEG